MKEQKSRNVTISLEKTVDDFIIQRYSTNCKIPEDTLNFVQSGGGFCVQTLVGHIHRRNGFILRTTKKRLACATLVVLSILFSVFNECEERHDLGIFYTCLDWLQYKFDIISFGPNHLIHIGHACAF